MRVGGCAEDGPRRAARPRLATSIDPREHSALAIVCDCVLNLMGDGEGGDVELPFALGHTRSLQHLM